MSLPSGSRGAPRARRRTGLRRQRLRVSRCDARDARAHAGRDGDRVRRARDRGVGEAARAHVRRRRAGPLLRQADARRRRRGRSTSAAGGCTTRSTRCSSSTGRHRQRGRSTPRRRSDPQRVTQRRRYRTQGRRIVDISDESLDGSAVEGASVSDFLLEELERRREGRMRDIVATIQSDQYRLITAEPEGALVVQGGPGTGKTAVGLHRASWLLYTHREQLRRVLVVGPNPTFMDYVSHVLPALGEDAVEQRAVSELLDGVVVDARGRSRRRAAEGGHAARRSRARARSSSRSGRRPRSSCCSRDGQFVSVREREVAELLDEALAPGVPLTLARERFRMAVLRRFYERYGELLQDLALRSFDELERALQRKRLPRRSTSIACCRCRARTSSSLALLTSPSALAEAADGILERDEQKLLLRDRPRRAAELRLERARPAAARRRAHVDRRRAALLRARDRRRGAGSFADAAPARSRDARSTAR